MKTCTFAAIVMVGTLVTHPSAAVSRPPLPLTRQVVIHYLAHDGIVRNADVLLPRSYDAAVDPPLPLVISPHGRGVSAHENARLWGDLPGRDGFAEINPEGQGRRLALYSWGDPGQISDLARMPRILEQALPWVHVDRRRIYAVGGSMGGQETLLLVARYPGLLAGAVSFDAPTNLALRYHQFARLRHGLRLELLARYEVGGATLQPLRDVGRPEPDRLHRCDRRLRRTARDLVERVRPGRRRPDGTVRPPLSQDQAARPCRAGRPSCGPLASLSRDALELQAAAGARVSRIDRAAHSARSQRRRETSSVRACRHGRRVSGRRASHVRSRSVSRRDDGNARVQPVPAEAEVEMVVQKAVLRIALDGVQPGWIAGQRG